MNENQIPLPFYHLIQYFRRNVEFCKVDSIFRKSAINKEKLNLEEQLALKNYDYLYKSQVEPVTVAAIIKKFLDQSPRPLFSYEQYQNLAAFDYINDDQKLNLVITEVNKLPEVNKRILVYLIEFLKYIASFNQQNNMNIQNLSVCFAPCILKSETVSIADMVNIQKMVNVTLTLLEKSEQIFKKSFYTRDKPADQITNLQQTQGTQDPVSYTHLTLPTICSVQISVVAVSLKKKRKTQKILTTHYY
eukprot:TRINITY_DN2073_c0_g1_i3.p1 TRINITY_DN2073_c0_g1~~TRINITY_DN2073_c0_g1_i3.p1  ORF type:complete len:247 (-),score=47.42 TRINITY_DN2073_c0_g1_i3:86-826(-)